MKICSAGFSAEAWGEDICVYPPTIISLFADWQRTHTATLEQRMARGYDINAQVRLPFFSISIPALVWSSTGDSVDLFDSGTGYHNPVALKLGLNYASTFAYHDRPAQTGRERGSVRITRG